MLLPKLEATFRRSQEYGLDNTNFVLVLLAYSVITTVVFLLLGFSPFLWDKSLEWGGQWIETEFGDDIDKAEIEILLSLIFVGLKTIFDAVQSLPFELYRTFRIEKKHGFNRQTLGLFFMDKIKICILTASLGGLLVFLMLLIITVRRESAL